MAVDPTTGLCDIAHVTTEEEDACDAAYAQLQTLAKQSSSSNKKLHTVSFQVESSADWVDFVGGRKTLGEGIVSYVIPANATIEITELDSPVPDGFYVGESVLGLHVVRLLRKLEGHWFILNGLKWEVSPNADDNARVGDIIPLQS